MNKILGLIGIIFGILFICMLLSTAIQAQSMYRCGSTYQDRPCEGEQKGKLIGGTSGTPSANGSVSDAACAQRGAAAQKIVWAREGGAMQDQQLAKAGNANEQKLISDVYARRGTSSDIRAAIEAECIAAKEKAAQVAALLDAARAGQSPSASNSATPQNKSSEADQKTADSASTKDNTDREAANKKIRCSYAKNQIEDIASKLRTGGNAATMEDLNQQKRNAERRLSEDKCG